MNLRRVGSIVLLSAAATLLFLLFTLLLIPDRLLLDSANSLLGRGGVSLTAARFSKRLPLGIKGEGWELSSQSGQLLKLDKATLGVELLPLLTGQVRIALAATVGGGSITGRVSLLKAPFCKLTLKGIQLEHVPFFATVAATQAAGILNAEIDLKGSGQNAAGFVKLDAQGVDLRGIKLGGTPLPDATYQTVQGMVHVGKGLSRLESLTLQGDGLYARLKGNIPLANPLSASPLELTLELMPKPELLEKQKFVFLLLTKYLDTPGHYQIPIKGTLGKPLME